LIRDAETADLSGIMTVERESFSRPWSARSFEVEFDKQDSDFLVLESDGFIAGYIIFCYILDEAEIRNIAVGFNHRRKGIAEKLINNCLDRHPEVRWIHLEVDKTNSGAICLYNKLGFEENGLIKNYYGKGNDALRMTLDRAK